MRRFARADLVQALERHVAQRTGGRVHRLRAEVTDTRASVHGRARSYYVKQLAIQACLEVLGADAPVRLDVAIEVGSGEPLPAH